MLLVIIATSVIDLAGLAAFIPVLSAVADPSLLEGEGILAQLKSASQIQTNSYFLLSLFGIALGFFILRAGFIFWSHWMQNKFVFGLNEYLGTKTYQYYMNSSFEDFQKRDSAEVVRELTVNPQHFAKFLVLPLLLLITETLIIGMIVIGIAFYNIEVFLLLILTVFPVAFLFNKLVKSRMNRYGIEQNELTPQLYSHSNRGMFGYVDVKLRNKENLLISDYIKILKRLNRINLITGVLNIMPAKLFEVATISGLLVLFVYASFWADNTALILPLIALYAAAGYRVIPSLSKIVPAFMQLEQYQYLFGIFKKPLEQQKTETESPQIKIPEVEFKQQIELKNVSFRFKAESQFLFNDFNLHIKKGEIMGFVGKSGSGKTTLVKIIAGFLEPTNGKVLIDGQPLNLKNKKGWMQQISYVQQSPYIETGSIAQNIAFLEREIDQTRLKKAIQGASLIDFLNGRDPNQVFLEENGKNLSGGQKQRIIIARALYHQAKLIILDEATSALDNETEKEITQTINGLRGSEVTILIIAHRLSTLEGVDKIVNIESLKED